MTEVLATRYHDLSIGHRVVGHENKCRMLHGHNLRIHFACAAEELDGVGRVIDFSDINKRLCMWLEDNWDHKMLLWESDPLLHDLRYRRHAFSAEVLDIIDMSIVPVPFNPTSELIALHLLHFIGPKQLQGTGVRLVSVQVDETRKCFAIAQE
jgi:6-pyruvoyltetrahydropterin/6-carboxytetrahydropterin synthase